MLPLLLATFIALTPVNTPYPKVLDCIVMHESGGRQFTANGSPLLSPTHDVGIMQINLPTWSKTAQSMGLDIRNNAKDNVEFGIWLYGQEGTKPWVTAKYCKGEDTS